MGINITLILVTSDSSRKFKEYLNIVILTFRLNYWMFNLLFWIHKNCDGQRFLFSTVKNSHFKMLKLHSQEKYNYSDCIFSSFSVKC